MTVAAAMLAAGLLQAQTVAPAAPAFQPTRFLVGEMGNAGGPAVILIPGLGCSRDVWKDEAARLAPNYHLYLVQVRGFAGYPAGPNAKGPVMQPIVNELAQYIQLNGIKQPAIIGHSMGGTMGLMLAEQHPEDVGKLMIVDAFPFLGVLFDPLATAESAEPYAEKAREQLLEMGNQDFLKQENGMVSAMVKTEDKRKTVLFWTVNSDRHTLGQAFYDDSTTDLRRGLPKVQTSITVLYPFNKAVQKQPDTDKMYQEAYARAPHATLVKIDDSAHFIMLDQPTKFDEQVEKFLKQ